MIILLSGYHNPHFFTITEYIEKAISDSGHKLYSFDDRHFIFPGRLRKISRLINTLDINQINKNLLSIAEKKSPNIAIITGGHRISGKTIEKLKEQKIKTVLWTIDAPSNFRPILNASMYYDLIFCQGSEAVEMLNGSGIANAKWLPMACDPEYHYPVKLQEHDRIKYECDLAFVGSFYPNRAKLFEKLTQYNLAIWGPGWNKLDKSSPLKANLRGESVRPESWIKIYSASKIVLAPHYQAPCNKFPVYQASPRIFEAMSCGAFLITDEQRDVLSLFKDGSHLAIYQNSNDLINKVEYYLTHPEERKRISEKGRMEVLKKHTYQHRIKELINTVNMI